MSFDGDAMQTLAYKIRDLNANMDVIRKLNELLECDIELRRKEYALRIYQLSKQGVTEESIIQNVSKPRR